MKQKNKKEKVRPCKMVLHTTFFGGIFYGTICTIDLNFGYTNQTPRKVDVDTLSKFPLN